MNASGWVKKNFIILSILTLAIILRFIAVNPGYNQYHGDETAIWGSALDMVRKSTWDPGRYDYPATTIIINFIAYKYFFVPLSWIRYYFLHFGNLLDGNITLFPIKDEARRVFETELIGSQGVNAIFWSRYVTAIFGVGSVLLTYVLGKKMFSTKVGLLAALFLTFNYRNVVNSHLALPDIYNAFFVLLSLIASWDLMEKPSRRKYLIAGILSGLAFSVKYQFFAVVPLVFAHFSIVFNKKFSLRKLFHIDAFISAISVLVIFLITNPFFFIRIDTVVVKMQEEFIKYGMGTNQLNFYPLSYFYHIDYGAIESFLVILGIVIALIKKPKQTLYLFSIIVPIFYIFLYYSRGGFYVRNFITVTPLLLIFAAFIFWHIIDLFKNKLGSVVATLIFVPALVATLYVPAKNSIISSYGFTLPWGYGTLRPWVQQNIPKDVMVAAHPFDKSNLGISNKTTEFAPSGPYALAEHEDNGDSYVMMDMNWASLPFYNWMSYGPEEVGRLWNKPVDILRNTFHGLAAEEMIRYQIHTQFKPWQSPDTDFVVVKVPVWPKVQLETLKQFAFDRGTDGWRVYGKWNDTEDSVYAFDGDNGRSKDGSLVFTTASMRFSDTRITSPAIEVDAGHLYQVSGFIKTETELSSIERDGFLRVDFYNDTSNFDRLGRDAAVSSRVYGSDEWVERKIVGRVPDGAKYMTVSFQTYPIAKIRIWVDDIVVKESKEPVKDITQQEPYTKDSVDLNTLYPNSHGNL